MYAALCIIHEAVSDMLHPSGYCLYAPIFMKMHATVVVLSLYHWAIPVPSFIPFLVITIGENLSIYGSLTTNKYTQYANITITHWIRQHLRRLDSHRRHIASSMSLKWYVFEAPVLISPAPRFLYRFDYSFLFFPYLFFVSPSHIRMFSRTDHYLLLTFCSPQVRVTS